MSATARTALGLGPQAPLSPWVYAEHIGVSVLDARSLGISIAAQTRLFVTDSESWSGMTLKEGETIVIVLNPAHAPTRQCSTLMHELAHVLLGHVPARVDVSASGLLLLSDYSDDQESEADWLMAAMLLPRDALMARRMRGMSAAQIAEEYGVSESLCNWRLRMTGVDVQVRRSARYR